MYVSSFSFDAVLSFKCLPCYFSVYSCEYTASNICISIHVLLLFGYIGIANWAIYENWMAHFFRFNADDIRAEKKKSLIVND